MARLQGPRRFEGAPPGPVMMGPGMGPGPGALVLAPGGWRQIFLSLSSRNFRIYWIGMLFSFIGMQVGQVARGWLVYELTGSATYLGVVGAMTGLPMLVFSLLGGLVADRVIKRNLLIVTQAATGLLAFVIAFLITVEIIQPWHVVAVAFITGIIFSFNAPGRQAILAELVEPHQLMNAIALNTAGMNLTRIVAPAVAGVLVAIIGLAGTYYVYAFQYLIAIAFLLMLPAALAYRERMGTMGEDLAEGISYVMKNKVILGLMVLTAVPAVFAMPYIMLMPVVADLLKVGPQGLGMMMGVSGIGALAGSLLVASLGDFRRKGLLMLLGALVWGVAIIAFGLSSSFLLSLVILLFLGAAGNINMAVNNVLVLTATPEEIRGRVMGVYMISWGLMPLGTLPAGILGDIIGVPMVIALGGAVSTAVALVALLFVPAIRKLE